MTARIVKPGPSIAASRLAPAAIEAERAMIGSLLVEFGGADAALVVRCADIVTTPEAFNSPLWRAAWQSIHGRAMSGQPFDTLLVVGDLEANTELMDQIPRDRSLASQLMHASRDVPVAMYAPEYARQVALAYYKRQIIEEAGGSAHDAFQHTGTPEELRDTINNRWQRLETLVAESESGNIRRHREQMERDAEHGAPSGISTGIPCIDEWTYGCIPGQVWIIAGYSGLGKTWLACSIVNGLIDEGAKVGFISLEMSPPDLLTRLLAGRVGAAAAYRYRRRKGQGPATWSKDDRARLDAAWDTLEAGLEIFENQRTIDAVVSCIRRGGFDAVVVDYGQLIEVPKVHDETASNSIAAKRLQAIAKASGVPLIVLSQVSNQGARMGDDDPAIGLKNSSSWVNIADAILMLRRDKDRPEILTLIGKKVRHGPSGGAVASLRMDPATGVLTEEPAPLTVAQKMAMAKPAPAPEPALAQSHWTDFDRDEDPIPDGW